MTLVDARGDRHAEGPLALGAAVALAGMARRLDDLAFAAALRAGTHVDHLAEHRLADAADLAATLALRARHRIGPGLGAVAVAGLAGLQDPELDLLLGPLDRLLEGDPQVVAEVRARLRPPAPRRPGAGPAAEERIEDVGEAAEPLEPGAATGAAVHPGPPEHVVPLAALGIAEDLVGLVDLLEPLLRLRFGVDVRVPLLGELAEGALDLGIGRAALDAEHLVVVVFGGGHARCKDTGGRATARSRARRARLEPGSPGWRHRCQTRPA